MVGLGAGALATIERNGFAFRPWIALNQIFDQWICSLSLWLPPKQRPPFLNQESPIWIFKEAEKWAGRVDNGGQLVVAENMGALGQLLNRYPRRARVLVLDSKAVIRTQVQLPLAAFDGLRQVMRFEIDRLTPFSENEVAFDVRPLDLNIKESQMSAELVAVPLSTRNALMQELKDSLGVVPNNVDVADVEGNPLGLTLADTQQYVVPRKRQYQWGIFLLSIVMLCCASWLSIRNVRNQADALQAQLKPRLETARNLSVQRQRLADLVASANLIQHQREQRGDITSILNALASQLPSNVYVERMTLVKNDLKFSGRGATNIELLNYLTENSFWGAPLFSETGVSGVSSSFDVTLPLKARN